MKRMREISRLGPADPFQWPAKLSLVLMAIVFVSCASAAMAFASSNPVESIVGQQVERLPTEQVEQFWAGIVEQYGQYFPGKPPSFMELILSGSESLSFGKIIMALLRYLFHEVLVNGKLLATIVVLTVFSMILETVQSAFEKQAVSKIGYAIVYLVLILIALNSFHVAIGYAKEAISSMIQFMVAIVPLLLTLLASMGNVTTVTVLHPFIVFMINAMGTLIYFVIFPLLFYSVVLHIISSLSDRYKLTELARLLQRVGVGLLGLSVTVFLGVLSIHGLTGSTTDGIIIRTAKYLTGNFIPVVGRLFTDASETVIGATLLVKNAIGLVGVIMLVFFCAFPAVKIMTLTMIYYVSSAVMQPLGDSPIVKCLRTIGKSMMYVFASMAAVGLLFFLAITIIITASNVSVMIR